MTIDCAKCGNYLTEAAKLQGTMEKKCGMCGCSNKVEGNVKGNTITVAVTATEPEAPEE